MKPTIICLTPIKNESWILDKFLKATSIWADHIIIADQMSTDGSREICTKYDKVILIDNPSETFNEPERQKLLINEARKIEGQRLLITLDADEIFSPNFKNAIEWETMLQSPPGTVFKFRWANLMPGLKKMFYSEAYFPWAYMDNGQEHHGSLIHSTRIPFPEKNNQLLMNDINVIHFQYTDWERTDSKHRWYQCFERVTYKDKTNTQIFRIYNKMCLGKMVENIELVDIPKEWFLEYKKHQIDISSVCHQSMLWWDKHVLNLMDIYGVNRFRHLNIWYIDWCELAQRWEKPNPEKYKDPRKKWEKFVNKWLINTQSRKDLFWIEQIEKLINLFY